MVIRPIAALGRFTLSAGRRLFSMLGGMSLLFGEALCCTAKGLIIPAQRIRRRVTKAAALIVASPEYHGSMSGTT